MSQDPVLGAGKQSPNRVPTSPKYAARSARSGATTSFAYISGQDTGERRRRVLDLARRGEINILISSVILDEGVDIPNIAALILAGGGRAAHRQIQRIGRGLRRIEGKDRLRVFDFDDRGFYLGRHARARRRTYDKELAYNVSEVTPEELDGWLTSTS